jgi:hypothetical protein
MVAPIIFIAEGNRQTLVPVPAPGRWVPEWNHGTAAFVAYHGNKTNRLREREATRRKFARSDRDVANLSQDILRDSGTLECCRTPFTAAMGKRRIAAKQSL